MSTDTVCAGAPNSDTRGAHVASIDKTKISAVTLPHSPPDSNNAERSIASESELSDLEDDSVPNGCRKPAPTEEEHVQLPFVEKPQTNEGESDDIGEVFPDSWSGGVPVFKPTMYQFKDFKHFMSKVNSYGMKSGIIKIVPPQEWKDAQPPLDDLIKQVRVRDPIKQDIMGSNGTYRQVNILHGRSYNLPQWRQLCEQSEHQPPARRGERRANTEKAKAKAKAARARAAAPQPSVTTTLTKKRGRGRPPKAKAKQTQKDEEDRPITPVSPSIEAQDAQNRIITSVETPDVEDNDDDEAKPRGGRMGAIRTSKPKTQSTSARRKYSRREGSAMIDERAFQDFDYKLDLSDYTPERCEELERAYWKTLTYAQPLYGADLMGTLFDDRTETWNLNKLPNLLDVLGSKIPGVNTAYLYLGMWKATFAWHLEDVDLYSINYVHFGAPKQWYSISQADARRFEAAMKSIWPADAKACNQFLRHKAFLISPQHLLSNFGIKVNKVLSYPGEFVVTYPYGYHSGYNLGYNCAEAVNFALDPWLEMGKIAKKCECAQAQDSVWINVHEIERKLRGEETEYEETEEEDDDEDEEDEADTTSGLPTPPSHQLSKFKRMSRKRKRGPTDKRNKVKVKKIKLRLKTKTEPPCCLCPNDVPGLELLQTEIGQRVHRMCALYLPETYVDKDGDKEVVFNTDAIHKDRLELKCLFCRSKRGACFQCSQKKCARSYHATCAAAAGVFVEDQDVPVFGEDGTEYKEQAFEFSCRYHRTKRDKKLDGAALEVDPRISAAAREMTSGTICQLQFHKGDIFAGIVVENRTDERTLLVDVIPNGDRVEVEWKWLLLADPSDYHLPKASSKAVPLPQSQKAKDRLNAKRAEDEKPRKDDIFSEGYTWAEFHIGEPENPDQAKVDLAKGNQIWHYLERYSTDSKAQFTEDPSLRRHNAASNFLDTDIKMPRAHKKAAGPRRPYLYKPKVSSKGSSSNGLQYTPERFTPQPPNSSTNTPSQMQSSLTSVNTQPIPPPSQPAYDIAQPLPNTASSFKHGSSHSSAGQMSQSLVSDCYNSKFFQVHQNRDSSTYRTPYAPWGGFTNGYQGNLRAYLTTDPGDLLRRTGSNSQMGTGPLSTQKQATLGQHQPSSHVAAVTRPSHSPAAQVQAGQTSQISRSLKKDGPFQVHPSIKPRYTAGLKKMLQNAHQSLNQQQSNHANGSTGTINTEKPTGTTLQPATTTPPTTSKLGNNYNTKQSPVPLPANFLAAMGSSPQQPTPNARQYPSHPPEQTNGAWAHGPPTIPPRSAALHPTLGHVAGGPSTNPVLPPLAAPFQTQQSGGQVFDTNRMSSQPRSHLSTIPPKDGGFASTQALGNITGYHGQSSGIAGRHEQPSNPLLVGPQPVNLGTHKPAQPSAGQPVGYAPARQDPVAGQRATGLPNAAGNESKEFVQRMMNNLRKASLREDVST